MAGLHGLAGCHDCAYPNAVATVCPPTESNTGQTGDVSRFASFSAKLRWTLLAGSAHHSSTRDNSTLNDRNHTRSFMPADTGGAGAERQTFGSGVYLRRSAHQAGQHGSLVQGAQARRYRGLSMARSEAHVGELARAGRDSALRVTGARRMGDREDGAALRAPGRGASGGLRQQHGKSRHKYGTTTGLPRHSPIASGRKLRKFVVARGGIEPPTRGFSVQGRKPSNPLILRQFDRPGHGIFCAVTQR
jgi:hypothetical protein